MSFQAPCPECQAPHKLDDSLRGKRIRCKECRQAFVAGAASRAEDEEPVLGKVVEEEEGAEERGPSDSRSRPVRRRRTDDDEEEDDSPPARRRRGPDPQSSNLPVLLIVLGVCAVLMLAALGALGFAAWWFLKPSSPLAVGTAKADTDEAMGPAQEKGAQAQTDLPRNFPPVPGIDQPEPAGQPAPVPQMPIILSQGRIGRGFAAQQTFSVNYRFAAGGPTPGNQYFLVIQSPRGRAAARYTWIDMRSQGSLEVESLGAFSIGGQGPYEAYMEMEQLAAGPFGGRERISNTVKLEP